MAEALWEPRQRRWFWVYVGLVAAFWGLAWIAGWEWHAGPEGHAGGSRAWVRWQWALVNLALLLPLWRGRRWTWFLLMTVTLWAVIVYGWFAATTFGPSLGLLALAAAAQLLALWSLQAADRSPPTLTRFRRPREEQ